MRKILNRNQQRKRRRPKIESDEYEEIDPQLVDAGRRFGLSDSEIVRYAETDPLYLRQIKDYLDEDKSVETKPIDNHYQMM